MLQGLAHKFHGLTAADQLTTARLFYFDDVPAQFALVNLSNIGCIYHQVLLQ